MFLVWPTKFEKYFEFYAQLICCLKKKKGDCLKSKFLGELGFKSWVCENHFISYSCIFFIIFQCFKERLHKILLIFKNSFFLQFWLIEFVFRAIEIAIKNFSESLSISIDRNCFWINRISWIRFFKIQCLTRSKHFFKSFFSTFLSLSDSAKQNHPIFVVFLRKFCKVFLSQSG